MERPMDFERMAIVVTGGANGIGLATSRVLLARGARVCIAGNDQHQLACAEKVIVEDGLQERLMTVRADVTKPDDVEQVFSRVEGMWTTVDALVNNAGVSGGRLPLSEVSLEDWDRMLTANLRGVYLCSYRALPGMVKAGWGRIVSVSSIAGMSAKGFASPHYSAAKGGIIGFTKRLAAEAAPHSVAVNCVAPGLIANTGFTVDIAGELLDRYLDGIPANRPGTTDEVAELIAYLLSPQAGFIIGQTIVIDGGASA